MQKAIPVLDVSTYPISQRWPTTHPDVLQLYSFPTSNGVKVSITLEELGLPYEAHTIDVSRSETRMPQYLTLNPNGKIPAIIDPDGPDGTPIALFESGAILLYLAEKTGKLLPVSATERYETIQWVFFQMSGVGPTFGQLGYFHKFAGREIEDKRPLERYRVFQTRGLCPRAGRGAAARRRPEDAMAAPDQAGAERRAHLSGMQERDRLFLGHGCATG